MTIQIQISETSSSCALYYPRRARVRRGLHGRQGGGHRVRERPGLRGVIGACRALGP